MDRYQYYFKQPVSDVEFNAGFAAAEAAICNQMKDRSMFGIVSGFVPTAPGSWNIAISAGLGVDKNGARLKSGGTITASVLTDTLGVSTVPSASNRRWVSIYARFGRNLTDSRTDGDANPIKFNQAEALNPDDVQAHVGQLLIVQGTQDLISNPLPARPALHSSAVLLADVLINDGDSALVIGNVDSARAERISSSSLWAMPPDTEFAGSAKFLLVNTVPLAGAIKVRHYVNNAEFAIVYNASWDPVAQKWVADDVSRRASKLSLSDGILFRIMSDTSTPWTAWDSVIQLSATAINSSLLLAADSDFFMTSGSQHVLWGLQDEVTATSGGGLTKGSMVTYPKTFGATPSSVTIAPLGSDSFGLGGGSVTLAVANSYPGGAFIAALFTDPTVFSIRRTITAMY